MDDIPLDETSFIDPVPIDAERAEGRAGPTVASLQQALLQSAVDDYYNAVAEKGQVPLGRDPSNFEIVGRELRLKAYPNVRIVNVRSRAPLALSQVEMG